MRQWLSRILAVLLLVPGLGLLTLDQALAGQCRLERTSSLGSNMTVVYKVVKVDCSTGQTPASGSPAGGSKSSGQDSAKVTPPCDVKGSPPATFCWGSAPCYIKDVVTPYAPPASPAPTPGADWQVRMCQVRLVEPALDVQWDGIAFWVGQAPQPPPLIDQAREASGLIRLPTAKLSFNPTRRTLVNLDTWFWAEGLTGGERRGTSAFGLVAIATPGKLVVTPGDGSAPLPCGWVTVKSDACPYAYRRASVGGTAIAANGAPAYQASGRATWTLRFENNDAPVTIVGAPTTLDGPVMTAAVQVAEVQTLVTGAH